MEHEYCDITEYVFVGDNKLLKAFRDNITIAISQNRRPNGFGNCWLGNILEYNGYDGMAAFISSGTVSSIGKIENNSFKLTTICPHMRTNAMFEEIISSQFKGIKMYWFDYDEFNGLIYTNDKSHKYFPYKTLMNIRFDNRNYSILIEKWNTSAIANYVNKCLLDSGKPTMKYLMDMLNYGVELKKHKSKDAIEMIPIVYYN